MGEAVSVRNCRIWVVFGILSYVALFNWMYRHYLYEMWDYFGYEYTPLDARFLLLAWILSVAPSFWMPMKLSRASQLIYWILYFFVIIPSMFVPLYISLSPRSEVIVLMLTLYAGFLVAGSSYLLPLLRIHPPQISRRFFSQGFGLLALGLMAWVIVVFRNNLHFVSFQNVYDLRDSADDLAEGSIVNYGFMSLTGAINPFLMGWGLWHRRKWIFIIGAMGQILVYSALGTKSSILSVLFLPCIYLLLRKERLPFAVKLTWSAVVVLAGLCVSYVVLKGHDPGSIQTFILSVVFQRTMSSGGLATAQYYEFFQKNPLTYLSHIHGVNLFVHYPYAHTIGQEIGLAYSGGADLDATAHFWAFDGLGGFGLPGVLLVSVLCGLVFWVLDSAAQRHRVGLAALMISFAALNLANLSIFTSLLSGGLALLVLALYLMPPDDRQRSFQAECVKPGSYGLTSGAPSV